MLIRPLYLKAVVRIVWGCTIRVSVHYCGKLPPRPWSYSIKVFLNYDKHGNYVVGQKTQTTISVGLSKEKTT